MNPLLALAPALASLALASGATTSTTASQPGCLLLQAGSERASVSDCLACHPGSGSGHKVGMPYAASRGPGMALRAEADVVRLGVFLPGGEVRCTTCHDGRSRVAYRLALPPGGALEPAVVPGDPSTYTRPPISPAALVPGQRVSAKPLCLACHPF